MILRPRIRLPKPSAKLLLVRLSPCFIRAKKPGLSVVVVVVVVVVAGAIVGAVSGAEDSLTGVSAKGAGTGGSDGFSFSTISGSALLDFLNRLNNIEIFCLRLR